MKTHNRIDAELRLIVSLAGSAGKVACITQANQLLYVKEQCVSADAGYTGTEKRE